MFNSPFLILFMLHLLGEKHISYEITISPLLTNTYKFSSTPKYLRRSSILIIRVLTMILGEIYASRLLNHKIKNWFYQDSGNGSVIRVLSYPFRFILVEIKRCTTTQSILYPWIYVSFSLPFNYVIDVLHSSLHE